MGRKAKFTVIADQLQGRIKNGEFETGDTMPPERQLADEYGVTRLTLRKAMSMLAKEGLVTRHQGRGTFVSKSPLTVNGKQGTVIYLGNTTDHFYQPLYSRLCAEAQDRGRTIVAYSPQSNGQKTGQDSSILKNAPAVICAGLPRKQAQALLSESTHVIWVSAFYGFENETANDEPGFAVSTDSYRASRLATEHLVELGHHRIAFYEAGRTLQDDGRWSLHTSRSTYLGYRSGLRESGITDEYTLAAPGKPMDDWEEEEVQRVREYLKSCEHRPTAVLCAGDFRASIVIRAAHDLGLDVPDDLSIIGMGDTPWARLLSPPLTTVNLGEDRLARLALLLVDEPTPQSFEIIRVTPRLIERRSTSPAPANN